MRQYDARWTTEAMSQLDSLLRQEGMDRPLSALLSLVAGWVLYGPIALDKFYEGGSLVDRGGFRCGTAHELTQDPMIAYFSISNDRTLLTVSWIERE